MALSPPGTWRPMSAAAAAANDLPAPHAQVPAYWLEVKLQLDPPASDAVSQASGASVPGGVTTDAQTSFVWGGCGRLVGPAKGLPPPFSFPHLLHTHTEYSSLTHATLGCHPQRRVQDPAAWCCGQPHAAAVHLRFCAAPRSVSVASGRGLHHRRLRLTPARSGCTVGQLVDRNPQLLVKAMAIAAGKPTESVEIGSERFPIDVSGVRRLLDALLMCSRWQRGQLPPPYRDPL